LREWPFNRANHEERNGPLARLGAIGVVHLPPCQCVCPAGLPTLVRKKVPAVGPFGKGARIHFGVLKRHRLTEKLHVPVLSIGNHDINPTVESARDGGLTASLWNKVGPNESRSNLRPTRRPTKCPSGMKPGLPNATAVPAQASKRRNAASFKDDFSMPKPGRRFRS